jgi:two-component system, OmpR family, sensor histidine kinase VicK
MLSKIKEAVSWPEFRSVWILLGVVVAAFAVDFAGFTSGLLILIAGGLLLIVFVLVVVVAYRAAATDRGTKIDQSELKSILTSLNDALIVYDENFKALFFNPAAEHLFRLAAKNVLGHRFTPQDVERAGWRTLIQVIFPSLAPRVIVRSKAGEYPQVVDASFSDPELELRVTTAAIADEDGKTLGFMKIIRDRTAQIAALRARSEFVTVASHQLRGPITDINWALESLASSPELGESNKPIVANALAASHGIIERIEGLINISKMDEGKFGYQFAETDAAEFVGKVLSDVLPAARKAGVKIYFDRPQGGLPKAMIDPQRLSLALVNILENAIRYNVANGEVTVKVDAMPQKPFLEVSVKDTGIGVPAEAMGKLFTKFYRADNAMKSQTEGSGLGLYIAKGIIRAHGGEIWIDSELNRGTTVYFTLPTDPNLVPKHEVEMEDLG